MQMDYYPFWKTAYERKWVTIEHLRVAVITETRPFGDITKEQFEEITGIKF